ncbi:hypothetical protein CM49_04826 [Paenibacillus sp. P1XP2]|nr:hypothetical protein CM49_04826 [Paenibacillus sp. P1XP2]
MNMKKAYHLVLMIMLSSMLALAGCGKGDSGKPADSASAGGSGSDAGLKPYKITLVYPATAPKDLQLVQDEMSKYLTEKINATIELKPIEWASWDDKTNLMKI